MSSAIHSLPEALEATAEHGGEGETENLLGTFVQEVGAQVVRQEILPILERIETVDETVPRSCTETEDANGVMRTTDQPATHYTSHAGSPRIGQPHERVVGQIG